MPKRRFSSLSIKSNTSSSRFFTRPGVEAAARLVALQPVSKFADAWERALSYYDSMMKAKGGQKLLTLDQTRDDIASKLQNSSEEVALLTKDQLLDTLIEWKFLKGKPRHALRPLLQSNSNEAVLNHSKKAFEIARKISVSESREEYTQVTSAALSELCKLKGVGPATASSILAMYRPDVFSFMDDEVIECLYNGKRGYTLKIYMTVNGRCKELAHELEQARDNASLKENNQGNLKWTPYRVGQALWTVATMAATNCDELKHIFNDVVEVDCSASTSAKPGSKTVSEMTEKNCNAEKKESGVELKSKRGISSSTKRLSKRRRK